MNHTLCATVHKVKFGSHPYCHTHNGSFCSHDPDFAGHPSQNLSLHPGLLALDVPGILRGSISAYILTAFNLSALVCPLGLRYTPPFLIQGFPENPYLRLRLDQFLHSCLCLPLSPCPEMLVSESRSHACSLRAGVTHAPCADHYTPSL